MEQLGQDAVEPDGEQNEGQVRIREQVEQALAGARTADNQAVPLADLGKKLAPDLRPVFTASLESQLAAGTLPGFYVESVAVVENGCWPLPLPEVYAWDVEHLKEYVKLAATDEGFAKYLDLHVYERRAA